METEQIVLLNEQYQPIGSAPKLASHHAHTPLHLAFSSYIFSHDGKLLVTRRADTKKVWPGVWTNTCCGHPAPGETSEHAIQRRLQDELGMQASDITSIVSDYRYTTPPFHGIIENEFCPVYVARADSDPAPNPDEVGDWRWISWSAYCRELDEDNENVWSWWCKDQLRAIQENSEALRLIEQFSGA